MEPTTASPRPVLYWDGECGFCRRWVDRWESVTGPAVDYRRCQDAPPAVVEAAGGDPPQRIVLALPDGTLLGGASAALTALAPHSVLARAALAVCRAVPPAAALAEWCYAWIAAHRPLAAAGTQLLWGGCTRRPTYEVAGWWFPRLMGLVFLCAFLSLWVQIDGLAGSRGILPVAAQLAAVEAHFAAAGTPAQAWLQVPSLLWLGASDGMLHFWLAVGTAASLLLVAGFVPAAAAFVAWLCYLSFVAAVPVFLNFQWDALLLEAGLLTVLYVPWRRSLRTGSSAPTRIGRLLVWWLLFRLMFESGVVKLHGFDADGRNAWLDGSALSWHYFTQPIPVWTSWWMAQLPGWFHAACLVFVFAVELVAPFFIAGPRRLRLTAFWGFTVLMVLIMATGHYGFFNLLTLVLCLTLVDDASWPAWMRSRFGPAGLPAPPSRPPRFQRFVVPLAAAILVTLTTVQLLIVLRAASGPWTAAVLGPLAPLRSANSYGLFSVMTTERPEITIETGTDGINWTPVAFRHKASAGDHSLPFLPPHMPRLDWQMWFAALEFRASGRPPAWVLPFLERLGDGSAPVRGLLAAGADAPPPTHFRLRLDLLQFTDAATRAENGQLWQADPLPEYTLSATLAR
jgi:predicted DCC family thiol-disulfide oxidoreductase YuxK